MEQVIGLEIARQAKIGSIIPIYKEINCKIDPVNFFAKLTDYGTKNNSVLFESAEIIEKYGIESIGVINPCLYIKCDAEKFEIKALNEKGKKFLKFIEKDFDFCKELKVSEKEISGKVIEKEKNLDERERLKDIKQFKVLEKIAFKFKPTIKPVSCYGGLFGPVSFDFVEAFEELPKYKDKGIADPYYEFLYADNLFVFNHKENKLYLISNILRMNSHGEEENEIQESIKNIELMEEELNEHSMHPELNSPIKGKIETDTSKKEFIKIVEEIKKHIFVGDIFQAVPSRTTIMDFNSNPLEAYKNLKKNNPSPYMYYFKTEEGILFGASPEMYLQLSKKNGKTILETRPIAGTKPRGIVNGKINGDLDSRYETELKLDEKELAEHTMLVDLARNDLAKVCKTGTRHASQLFSVEKYRFVQHLVSTITGELREEFNVFNAFIALASVGTMSGAPKIKAMELLRKYEKTARGYYGGAICYLTPSEEFNSAIIIRSVRVKNKKAFIRSGAGIVFDSFPENEFLETENKAKACIEAIKQAGGVKFE